MDFGTPIVSALVLCKEVSPLPSKKNIRRRNGHAADVDSTLHRLDEAYLLPRGSREGSLSPYDRIPTIGICRFMKSCVRNYLFNGKTCLGCKTAKARYASRPKAQLKSDIVLRTISCLRQHCKMDVEGRGAWDSLPLAGRTWVGMLSTATDK